MLCRHRFNVSLYPACGYPGGALSLSSIVPYAQMSLDRIRA